MSQEEIVVPKGWELKKLSDVCKKITSGGTPNRGNLKYFGGDIPWLKIGDLNDGEITDSKEKITESGLKNSSAKLFPENTVLFAMYGATIGKTGILKNECATNQAICGMISGEKILPTFLLLLLQSKFYQIRKMAEGGAQPNINQEKLKNLEILLPPLSIQKQIVAKLDHILGELDTKKKQIISLIEQNKQRIDFFEKNWMLFLIDREIEKHPQRKEWELKKISDICSKISSGGTPSRDNSEYYGGDIPWLKIGDLNNGIILDSKEKITKAGFENSSAKLFPKNTVLFAMYGAQDYSSGITGIVTMDCTTNQAICGMVCGKNMIPAFLLYFLQSKQYKIRKMATGGAQKNLNQDKLKNLEIPLPPITIQKQIIQKIKFAEEKFQSQKKQFENIKNEYESKIKYIDHIQSSILNSAFSGKLLN